MRVIEELRALRQERFLAMYTDLSQHGFGPLDGEVAKQMKFRPQAIRKLPMAQRAVRAQRLMIAQANAELCYEFFGAWLIKERRDLVTGFLDATGVAHNQGMLEDLDHNKPDAGKLDAALADLDQRFAPEDVTLYLSLCAEQWPMVEELERVWRTRSQAAPAR